MKSFFLIAALVVSLDQLSKFWIVSVLPYHEIVTIIPGLFDLTHTLNTGAAFGILAGKESWRHIFFLVVGCSALAVLAHFYKSSRERTRSLLWGTSLVFGGALGNLIDRVRIRSVIDFLDFYIGTYHWPAFNIADSAITIGGALLILHYLQETKKA